MVQDASALIQTGVALEQEASTIEQERQRLESQRAEIERRNQEAERRKAEAEKARQQLETVRRMGGDTRMVEPFARQAQERYLTAAREQQAVIPGYNTAAEQFNARVETYKGQAEGYNQQVGEYNQQQEGFNDYLQKVAEGKDAPQTVDLRFSTRPGRNETIFRYGATIDIPSPGTSEHTYGETIDGGLEGLKTYGIEGVRKLWGLGPEDRIIADGQVIQESSLNPEQWTIARSVATGRQSALERYKREAELEQDRLKTEWLVSGRGSYVQPAAFTEAYKTQIGVAPSPGLTAVPKYYESQQQLVAKAAILSSPKAQHTSPEFYAAEATKLQERTATTIEPLRAERMQFKPPVRTDERGQIQFYGVQGAPGYQISEAARDRRLADINARAALRGPEAPNIIYTPAPAGPEFKYDPKYGFMKRRDLVETPEQKLLKGRDEKLIDIRKQWEGTYAGKAATELMGKVSEAEKSITGWENKKYMGAPDAPRIFVGEVAKAGVGLGSVVVGAGILAVGAAEKPVLAAETLKATAGPAIITLPSSVYSQFASPISERGVVAGSVANVGQVAGMYIGGKALGSAGKGIKDTSVIIPESVPSRVPAFPGYVILKKKKLPDGTIIIEEKTIDLSSKEKTLEAKVKKSGESVASISKQGVITIQKAKTEVKATEAKAEVIDLHQLVAKQKAIEARSMGTTDVTPIREFKSDVRQASQFPQLKKAKVVSKVHTAGDLLGYEPSVIKSTETVAQYKARIAARIEGKQSAIALTKPKTEALPVILPVQKAQAITKQEASTVQIADTVLKAEAIQQPVSKSLAITMQKSRQEPVVISKAITKEVQKEEAKQTPVVVPRLRLTSNQEAVQVTGIETPTITGTTTIDTTTPKGPRDFFRTAPDRPNERPPERPPRKGRKGEEKNKILDVKIKKTGLDTEPEKKGKQSPWFPASLESVTAEEIGLGGKRAKHIKSKKTSQELFKELKIKGKPIPTKAQYERKKGSKLPKI